MSPWRITGYVCGAVVVGSVLGCVALAISKSTGLIAVKVTALNAANEPVDHPIPLVKRKEALPDYALALVMRDGRKVGLGTKPDTSAASGLEWRLSDPVSVANITSVRLREQDKFMDDAVAEVQISSNSATENGYRFDFMTERSAAVGLASFFETAIGKAIVGAFFVAVLLMLVSALAMGGWLA